MPLYLEMERPNDQKKSNMSFHSEMERPNNNCLTYSPWHAEHLWHYIWSAIYYGFGDISKKKALDMLNIFGITFDQPSITVLEILAKIKKKIKNKKKLKKNRLSGNNSYKESSDDFGLNLSNVVLDLLNIFASTFDQPSITVLEMLTKKRQEIMNKRQQFL